MGNIFDGIQRPLKVHVCTFTMSILPRWPCVLQAQCLFKVNLDI